jgi:DNA-binding transcriptional LysR family regulator
MLDLDALKAFVAACEEGSVSRAAQRLFRSQPAVTRQILSLEKELGTVLLDRSSRGVRATPSGNAVFQKAQKLLRDVESLSGSAQDPNGDSGDLRIASSDTVAQYWLAPLLGTFAKSFPGARLHLDISSSPEIANRVASGLDDVGFVLLPLQHPSLLHRRPTSPIAPWCCWDARRGRASSSKKAFCRAACGRSGSSKWGTFRSRKSWCG